ncbi:hypothetical protein M5689_022668 [Euphorbia peplus]|nr:hypothetical protein M5689_022668 [Euphorbia peplus]
MWYATLNNNSRARFLSDDDNVVVECKRKYSERISNHGQMPLWENFSRDLTGIFIPYIFLSYTTLGDAIAYKEDDVSFFCVVRVVAINPFPTVHDLKNSYTLTLEDPTARINVLLYRPEELVTFFNEFYGDVLIAKIKEVLGVAQQNDVNDDDCTRFPPLVKICFEPCRDVYGNISYEITRTRQDLSNLR